MRRWRWHSFLEPIASTCTRRYGEFGGKVVDRDAVGPEHFAGWIDWAKALGIGLDFNPTYFSHPKAADNITLSHADPAIRTFWINHGIACRRIGAAMGKALGKACITNLWIPDGMKDSPIDRVGPRERLTESLDTIFKEPISPSHNLDSVEGKLFGIGCESFTVGSHEYYFGYALSRNKLLTLDTGHYHPTETVTDKLSAMFVFLPEILLHVSRGVRWDSDHVVLLNDDLEALSQELVRGNFLERTHIGLDFFDASINRVAAWTIGTRNMIKSLLKALLEPVKTLRALEADGDYTVAARAPRRAEDDAVRGGLGLLLRDEERARRQRVAGAGQDVRERRAVETSVAQC